MGENNNDKYTVDYSNTIKKNNELSMAKLNQGLTLNQMQLLAYAIFSTQQDGKTEFRKYELQDKFELSKYNTEDAYRDSQKLSLLQFSNQDLENDKFSFTNVFSSIDYEEGHFKFEWNKRMLPHILELKEKYIITDLTVTSNFRSGFSWNLYEFLKAHYGSWYKELSKDALMNLFAVEDKKTYKKSSAQLKRAVLDVAVEEINKYTELEVWYTQQKVGNKITGFKIYWSTGERKASITKKQMNLLQEIHNEIERRMFDYISLKNTKNLETARSYIIRIEEINKQVYDQITSRQASEFIKESKELYGYLQDLLEN